MWWLLCAGALARLGWLSAGAVRLRQLRQRSRAAVLTADLEAIRSDVAPRAELRVSCEVAQPAGFGLRHPVVLLPEGFFSMDPHAQRTVACHELLHVARRDWSWIVPYIRRMILREGMTPVAAGTIVGLAASAAVNRLLQSQLVGVSPYDPMTIAGAPALLIVVALFASLVPVRRAMQVDPIVALRHE